MERTLEEQLRAEYEWAKEAYAEEKNDYNMGMIFAYSSLLSHIDATKSTVEFFNEGVGR